MSYVTQRKYRFVFTKIIVTANTMNMVEVSSRLLEYETMVG